MDVNYIGDAGSSGNYFGVDPISFEVYVPVRSNFLVVVNTSSNAGIGQPYTITVQGFLDDQFTSTPEPSTLWLLGSGSFGYCRIGPPQVEPRLALVSTLWLYVARTREFELNIVPRRDRTSLRWPVSHHKSGDPR